MNREVDELFREQMLPAEAGDREAYEIRYAAAALLISCAKADLEEDPDEEEAIVAILTKRFGIDDDALDQLIVFAEAQTGALSLEAFTNLVNHHYSVEQKHTLVADLWRVAFADGRLDRYEDRFISRVAGLIAVDASTVGRLKASAAE